MPLLDHEAGSIASILEVIGYYFWIGRTEKLHTSSREGSRYWLRMMSVSPLASQACAHDA